MYIILSNTTRAIHFFKTQCWYLAMLIQNISNHSQYNLCCTIILHLSTNRPMWTHHAHSTHQAHVRNDVCVCHDAVQADAATRELREMSLQWWTGGDLHRGYGRNKFGLKSTHSMRAQQALACSGFDSLRTCPMRPSHLTWTNRKRDGKRFSHRISSGLVFRWNTYDESAWCEPRERTAKD